jgi:hypothetical protein
MARHPWTRDCEIKGCARAQYKAQLCAMHYAMVPEQMAWECAVACMTVSHLTARRHHRKMRAFVRKQVRESVAA